MKWKKEDLFKWLQIQLPSSSAIVFFLITVCVCVCVSMCACENYNAELLEMKKVFATLYTHFSFIKLYVLIL